MKSTINFVTLVITEGTFARKHQNIFGILLAYSYLCTQL